MKKVILTLGAISILFSMAACSVTIEPYSAGNTATTHSTATEPKDSTPETTEKAVETTPSTTANSGPKIDLMALDAMESKDTFPVKVTKKETLEDGFKEGFTVSLEGNDAYIFTVTNNTDSAIKKVVIYVVAYKEDLTLTRLQSNLTVSTGGITGLQAWESSDLEIAAGESATIAVKCRLSEFIDTRCIVASYTTNDGVVHENEILKDWMLSIQAS